MKELENQAGVEEELSQVERALDAPRRWMRGRAGFNSIGDSLRSVANALNSVNSADSATARLSQRLETAQLAYSSRTPLEVVQVRQLRQQQQQQQRAASVPSRAAAALSSDDSTNYNDTVQPHASGSSSQRRPSLLLASRNRSSQRGFDYSLEHFEAVSSPADGADFTMSKRNKLEVLQEAHQEESFGDESLEEGTEEVLRKWRPPTPVLLSRSQSNTLSRVLSDSTVSGSVQQQLLPDNSNMQPAQEQLEAGSVMYSWGTTGLQSLHDDDAPRTVEHARVGSDCRLGKPGAAAVLSVATSTTHTACALAQGSVLTWGQNQNGVVDPYAKDVSQMARPTLFESINNMNVIILQVSCGYDHTAALSEQGTVLTWGSNEHGQLGHRSSSSQRGGGSNNQQQPQSFCRPQGLLLTGGRRAAAVACGHYFTLVLTTRMCVVACGIESITGKSTDTAPPGEASSEHESQPKATSLASSIPALQGLPLVAVAAGHHHAVVLTSNGTAYAWGLNETGCCGRPFPPQLHVPGEMHVPPTSMQPTPAGAGSPFPNWAQWEHGHHEVSLADDVAVIHAALGESHTVLVTRSGRLLVCGSNSQGQVGVIAGDKDSISPVEPLVHAESGRGCSFVAAEAGSFHTLLLDSDGSVWQMGGAKGTGPECILSGKRILSIAAGGDQNIAIAAGKGALRRQFSITAETGTIIDSSALANNLEELLEMAAQDDDESAGEEIARRAEELLQSPAVMNSVFFDPAELDTMYSHLVSVGDAKAQRVIATAIERGITKGLESIAPDNARMIYPEAVRCLLLYIRFFDRPSEEEIAFDSHGKVISDLMEAILGLPFEGYKAFLKWATSLYSGELYVKMLIKPLISQLDKSLEVKVDKDEVQHASLSLGSVPSIVSVLQWLYKASERMGDIAKLEDFYSKSFDDIPSETLYEDLHHLKLAKKAHKRASAFYICASPFLFSPTVKRNLLQIESQIEMLKVVTADGVAVDPETGSIKINPFWKLEIDREKLLEQTLAIIKTTEPSDLRKKLQVVFTGEDGIDAGGLSREFFMLLSEDLFDINSGMWTDRFGDDVTWFNSDCLWDLEGFELTGVLVGLALYNSVLLDVHFPMAVYRKLLGYPLGLEDMVDAELQKGFQQLLDYEGDDAEDVFCLSFEVTWTDDIGVEKTQELKPGGSDIPVTSENREEYVRLYAKWLLVDSIAAQWCAFEKGMMRVTEGLSLDLLFRPEELKLLVVGSPELDFDALEANTEYEGGFDKDSETIKNFWKFIKNVDRDSQLNFLKFSAGSSMAPIGGLGALKFKIQRAGPDSPQLPTSHTCFNTLLLPEYGSYEKLEERLTRAIVECEGFGLE